MSQGILNKGGHSSVPSPDNAIYHLAEGLAKLAKFSFPLNLNTTTRLYFERAAELETPQTAADIRAVLAPNPDPAALARLSENVSYNAQLRRGKGDPVRKTGRPGFGAKGSSQRVQGSSPSAPPQFS